MDDPSSQSGEPTLAEDEEALATYASRLIEALDRVLGDWIRSSIARHDGALATTAAADRAAVDGSREVMRELRALLTADIADQTESPLQVVRRGGRFATVVLRESQVPAVARDEFAIRAFPDDTYDLTPASFGDIHASVSEPGLVWGAAKAHVHLRRRREQGNRSQADRIR